MQETQGETMTKSAIRTGIRLHARRAQLPLALIVLSLVAGCSNVKRELGVGRNSPDEFAVVKRAPLSLPPEYNLRAPSSEYLPPASEVSQQARGVLMTGTSAAASTDAADQSFLQRTGAAQADPDIRSAINRDNGYIALQSRTMADRLIFWSDKEADLSKMPASIVDATAEAERLEKNKQEGKAANDGNVPVIEKKQSAFDKIF